MPRTKNLIQAAAAGDVNAFYELPETEDIDSHKDEHDNTLLSIASRSGHQELVKLLLEKNANIDAKNHDDETPLSHAARNGHKGIVEILLAARNVTNSDSYTLAMYEAAGKGHEDIVTLLLENDNLDADAKDFCGSIALGSAAETGKAAIVKLLIERDDICLIRDAVQGAFVEAAMAGHDAVVEILLGKDGIIDINAADDDGRKLLLEAARYGRTNLVKMLLARHDVDVNTQGAHGWTALRISLHQGHKDVVELLFARDDLDLGVARFSRDESLWRAAQSRHDDLMDFLLARECAGCPGLTPISWSAENDQEKPLERLLVRKITDVNSKDGDGRTPLSRAAEQGHWYVVKMLIEHNADPNSWDDDGRMPLSRAAEKGNWHVVKMLIDHNADPNSWDDDGRTPLSRAAEKCNWDVVEMLIDYNADPNSKDDDGRTPLSRAAENGHSGIVERLLQRNADPDTKDNDGRTPLWWAVENGHEASVKLLTPVDTSTLLLLTQQGKHAAIKLLLRFKPRLDQRNHHGQSPLHLAALWGQLSIARSFIFRGAEISPKDNDNTTPLQLAIQKGHIEIIRELLEHKASTRGIMAEDWRTIYGKSITDIILLSEAPRGKQYLEFPDAFLTTQELSQKSVKLKSRLYILTDVLNNAVWSKVPLAAVQQQPVMNYLQISQTTIVQLTNNKLLDISISFRLSVSQYVNDQSSSFGDFKASRIAWRAIRPISPGSPWTSIVYFSTLPYGWIPDDGMHFFEQFLTHINAQWLDLCHQFGEYLSNKRLEQLKSKGESSKMTDGLAKDAQTLAELRTILAGLTSDAERFMNNYCAHYHANQIPKLLRKLIKDDMEVEINKKLEDLDQTVRDLLQIEFAWITIHETRISTKLGQNVMLLTYVSIFYLPLGFCAIYQALWAIPNITDDGTRTPFILTATMVSLITLLVTFNMEKIAAIIQRGYQYFGSYIAKQWDHVASKWNETKEAQLSSLP